MSSQEGCIVPIASTWEKALAEHGDVLTASEFLAPEIDAVVAALKSCIGNGGKILICGNGGSHAHAQHFAAELVVRFRKTRAPIAAIALGSNPAVSTAVINDIHPKDIFVRETVALLAPNDVLIGISTSGVSPNVCRALNVATEMKATAIGITGQGGMGAVTDYEIRIPSANTARIQEMHTLVIHAICEALDA